jgi:hypothetical protein
MNKQYRNPEREIKGLSKITPDEQVKCFEILRLFHANNNKDLHDQGGQG